MRSETCAACPSTRAELKAANKTILALVAEKSELLREHAELNKRVTLLEADVERYERAIEDHPMPHQPERVSKDRRSLTGAWRGSGRGRRVFGSGLRGRGRGAGVTDRCATSGFTVGPCTWPALLARA
jgi:hypothetical protein